MRRKDFLLLAAGSAAALFATGRAATAATFDAAAFAAAQTAGKPILVGVWAPWCETCARQRSVVSLLLKDRTFADLTVFSVDYDTQKDVMRSFGVRDRSTMVVFRGKTETGRVVGETGEPAIRALLATATA